MFRAFSKRVIMLGLTVLLLLCCCAALAEGGITSVSVDNVMRQLDAADYSIILGSGNTCTITKWTKLEDEYGTIVVRIPETIDGITVTALAEGLFAGNALIENLWLPDTVIKIPDSLCDGCTELTNFSDSHVTEIGKYAFRGCNVWRMDLTETVTIGDYAFQDCTNVTTIELSNQLTTIGNGAFDGLSKLTELLLPECITSIGANAFDEATALVCVAGSQTEETLKAAGYEYKTVSEYEYVDHGDGTCTISKYNGLDRELVIPAELDGLKVTIIGEHVFVNKNIDSVVIPEGVVSVETNAFNCCGLNSITLPESLMTIGAYAFGANNLESVYVPNGVTVIGDGTFHMNYDLTTVDLPANLVSLGEGVFMETPRLASITLESSNAFYQLKDNVLYTKDGRTLICYPAMLPGTDFTVSEGVTTIAHSAFAYANLTSIKLPSTLRSIGQWAFFATKMSSLQLPEGLQKIDEWAFQGAEITSIRIPAGITQIPAYAFSSCLSLQTVELPASIRTIGDMAFAWCKELQEIILPDYIGSIGMNVFDYVQTAALYARQNTLTARTLEAAGYAYQPLPAPEYLCEMDYSDNTLVITDYNGTATELVIPETIDGLTVGAIGSFAFGDCNQLTSVVIPGTVKSLGINSFGCCELLKTVVLEYGVNSINCAAFNSDYLKNITIPRSVTSFVDSFYSEVTVTCWKNSEADRWAQQNGYPVVYLDSTFEVDANGVLTAYKGTDTDVVIPSGVKEIGANAFMGNRSLCSVVIPEGVTAIQTQAFHSCTGLKSVSLPSTLQCIENFAFAFCTQLDQLHIPAAATLIEESAFVALPARISIDGDNPAFKMVDDVMYTIDGKELRFCPTFKSGVFVVPAGTEIISPDAFIDNGITEIHLPNSVEQIHSSAFSRMSALERFVLAEGSTSFTDANGMLLSKDGTELYHVSADYSGTLTVPETVQIIHPYAVCNRDITNVVLPKGIAVIYGCAFENLPLETINLPASLEAVWDIAFINCGSFTAEVYEGSYAHDWCLSNNVAVKIVEPYYTFTYTSNGDGTCTVTGCSGDAAHVVIPAKIDGLRVTEIGENAFFGVKDLLADVVIPEGVTSIGNGAFAACFSLKNVSLPSTLKRIESQAFIFCFSLEKMTIPAATDTIGEFAFASMPTVITVESSNTAFKTVDDVLYTIDGKELRFCPSFKSGVFSVPEGTEIISNMAFWGTDAAEIHLPASVKQLCSTCFGEMYFMERFAVDDENPCYADVNGMLLSKDGMVLYSVPQTFSGTLEVPGTVQTIKRGAVHNYSITNVVLPDGLIAIESDAFNHLPLLSINLPVSVTRIGDGAFYSCGDFTATVYKGSYAHGWCEANGIRLSVMEASYPDLNLPAFQLPAHTHTIEAEAFSNTPFMKVVLPDGCKTIGSRAFADCADLQVVIIPASVDSIAEDAFEGCSAMSIIAEPDSYAAKFAAAHGILWFAE